jgi:hypothetical protein
MTVCSRIATEFVNADETAVTRIYEGSAVVAEQGVSCRGVLAVARDAI